jgi:hypothetical protein
VTTRTLLLTLHVALAAAWIGADFAVHVLSPRLYKESTATQTSWARQILWLHEKYYAAVAVLILVTGVLLVLDGDWSWSSGFIWVGVGAIVGGATLGGGGLGSLAKRQLAGLEAGDSAAVAAARSRMVPLSLVVTALPIITVLAMVDKWKA